MLATPDERRAEESVWLGRIDPARLPRHVAIIMDGNGRWAGQRHLPRSLGHVRGATTSREIIQACRDLPDRLVAAGYADPGAVSRIEVLTLYTFSNENWSRPQDEVWAIMELIENQLRENLSELQEMGVAVRVLGRTEDLPATLKEELERDMDATAGNDRMRLYLALNYGGRNEIVDAARRLAERVRDGDLALEGIDEPCFSAHLYAPDVPDPELLIRTGGDLRVSNFLLWQIAYAELWVTPTLWPAFGSNEVYQAIAEYQTRERRFGGLSSDDVTS